MTLPYKIGLGLASLLLAFSMGRYTTQKTSIKTVNTSATVTDNKDVHKVEVVTKQPSGVVVDTITTDTVDITKAVTATQSKSETMAHLPKTNFSALFGTDLSKGSSALIPLYGVSIQRELIGPVTVGGFGLTNGTIGVSIGINF